MSEKQSKNYVRICLIAISICAALAAAYYLGGRSAATSTEIRDNTDRAMGQLKSEIQSAGSEITAGAGHAGAAGAAIQRADELIDRSQSAARDQSAGIKRVQDILGECQSLTGELCAIIRSADEEAGRGEKSGDQGKKGSL